MNNRLLLVFSFLLFSIYVQPAVADPTIGFKLDGFGFTNTFNVDVGDSITIQVFAIEGTDTRLTASGLQNVGTKATFSTAFGTVTNVAIATANFTDVGSGFNNSTPDLDLLGFSFAPAANAGSEIQIGEFTFQATSAGATVFSFGDYDPSALASNFTLGDGVTDLDPDFFGLLRTTTYNATINSINAVPEPATTGLLLISLAAIGFRRRLRISQALTP